MMEVVASKQRRTKERLPNRVYENVGIKVIDSA